MYSPPPPYCPTVPDLSFCHRVTPAGRNYRGRGQAGFAVEVVPSVVESGTELAGRYRLDRRLGVGGMGEVWQARDLKFERDLNLRRDVAIKLMHSTLTESDMLKRFQLEAKILSKLNHPHIVRMLDADWHEGQLFIVMELLADQDLGQLLSSSPRGGACAAAGGRAIRGPPARHRAPRPEARQPLRPTGRPAEDRRLRYRQGQQRQLGADRARRHHGHLGVHRAGAVARHVER